MVRCVPIPTQDVPSVSCLPTEQLPCSFRKQKWNYVARQFGGLKSISILSETRWLESPPRSTSVRDMAARIVTCARVQANQDHSAPYSWTVRLRKRRSGHGLHLTQTGTLLLGTGKRNSPDQPTWAGSNGTLQQLS